MADHVSERKSRTVFMIYGLRARSCTAFFVAMFFIVTHQVVNASDSPKKVAVVLNMGDPGILGSSLAKDQAQAEKVYRSLGYQVIVLTNDSKDPSKFATRQNLSREIGGLANVTDLKIDTLGHGRIQDATDVPAEYKDRFPVVPHTDAEKKAGFEAVNFSAPKVYVACSVTNTQLGYSNDHSQASYQTLFRDSIGAGDMRNILTDFQKKNPEAQTTMHMLNCFGASLGQGLSDMKNVIVFNATENSKTAVQYFDPKTLGQGGGELGTLNYMNNYYTELENEKKSGVANINFNSVHEKVALKMLNDFIPQDGRTPMLQTLDLPRSAAQNDLHRWCAAHPASETTRDETGKGVALCHCKFDTLLEDLSKIQNNSALVEKIGLPAMTEAANFISAEAALRLGKLVKKYCEGSGRTDPNGSIKKADLAALERAKKEVIQKALLSVEKDIKNATGLFPSESAEGKTAQTAHDAYSELLLELNKPRIQAGLTLYKGISDVPTSEGLRAELVTKWDAYSGAWERVVGKYPKLKNSADSIHSGLISAAEEDLKTALGPPTMEARIIESRRKALDQVKREFDWLGMVSMAKAKLCFVSGACVGVPPSHRIKKEKDPSEFEKQNNAELAELFDTMKRFSSSPAQDPEKLAQSCIEEVSRSGQPPGKSLSSPPPGGPPGGPGGPPGEMPDIAPLSPSEARAFNDKLLACVQKKGESEPYAAALALLNSANLTKDTDGRCPYWKANLQLYREDLRCGKRFAAQAKEDEIEQFINILRAGERAP